MARDALPALRKNILGGVAGRLQRLDKKGYLQNFLVVDQGGQGSSAQPMISAVCKTMKIRKSNVVTVEELPERLPNTSDPILLVLDDFAGTGSQLDGRVKELITSLDKRGSAWRETTTIIVGACLSASEQLVSGLDDGIECSVAIGLPIGSRLMAFSPEAQVFDSEGELEKAKDVFAAIGRSLVPNAPLGYGDSQLLVVLETNCPNNTIPAFWQSGSWGGRRWKALFERRT